MPFVGFLPVPMQQSEDPFRLPTRPKVRSHQGFSYESWCVFVSTMFKFQTQKNNNEKRQTKHAMTPSSWWYLIIFHAFPSAVLSLYQTLDNFKTNLPEETCWVHIWRGIPSSSQQETIFAMCLARAFIVSKSFIEIPRAVGDGFSWRVFNIEDAKHSRPVFKKDISGWENAKVHQVVCREWLKCMVPQ